MNLNEHEFFKKFSVGDSIDFILPDVFSGTYEIMRISEKFINLTKDDKKFVIFYCIDIDYVDPTQYENCFTILDRMTSSVLHFSIVKNGIFFDISKNNRV